MYGSNILIRRIILVSLALALISGCARTKKEGLINVLILSGKNNHEWQRTSPLLAKVYKDSRLFSVSITDLPDTLTYKVLKKYDAVVSNWNTWPDNDLRLTKEWENDFLRYVKEGGGVVFIHAGASSFYSWNEYHQTGIGRWGKETNHGEQQKGKIEGFDQQHPITKGFRDFYIVDELWEKTDIYPGATAIASVTAVNEKDGHLIGEKVVFVNRIGTGRSFFTTLGHNERALLNSGLQTLLLRGTQWVSHRKVTIQLPSDFQKRTTSKSNNLSWEQSDTTISLNINSDIIWQYNFNNRFGRAYFHPLNINNSTMTCASPTDHPWHLGLWFSWKFINGVNYWEYLDNFKSDATGYISAGITDLKETKIIRNADYSADILMHLEYHPADSATILTEERKIHVSPLFDDGSYFIDHEYIFNSLTDELVLDRTPIQHEPDGRTWGGYAGISVRFNQDYTSPEIVVPDESKSYIKTHWLYMGFNTLTGDTAGLCMFRNPGFTTPSTSWYVINDPVVPFFYYSPAVLYDGKIILNKSEVLHLKYRVWILPGQTKKEKLEKKYVDYLNNG